MPIQHLISTFQEQADNLTYANLNADGAYGGWTTNFNFNLDGAVDTFSLDLNQEDDLFLLFALASAWSRTGPWENAAYFVAFLKINNICTHTQWQDEAFAIEQREIRKETATDTSDRVTGITPRNNVAFRSDIYNSMYVLANSWQGIRDSLEESERQNDYMIFITHLRNINGLGQGNIEC